MIRSSSTRTCRPIVLTRTSAPGYSRTKFIEIPYTVNHTDAMTYGNDAAVTVQDNEGTPVRARAEQTVEVTDVLPTVTLVKSVDVATMAGAGRRVQLQADR